MRKSMRKRAPLQKSSTAGRARSSHTGRTATPNSGNVRVRTSSACAVGVRVSSASVNTLVRLAPRLVRTS